MRAYINECLDVLFWTVCVLHVCVNVCTLWFVVSSLVPLAVLSRVCVCVCALSPHLTGDLDGHWWDHASWHSSEASPMSLVRHVEPCLDPSLLPLTPISLSLSLSLSSPHPPSSRVFCHFMFPSFYLHLCMLFFCFSFCFLSHTCRGQSKGKKKNY